MLLALWADVRYSARTLARNPSVTALAVVTIALGIGVNAGILTTVDGLRARRALDLNAHDLASAPGHESHRNIPPDASMR